MAATRAGVTLQGEGGVAYDPVTGKGIEFLSLPPLECVRISLFKFSPRGIDSSLLVSLVSKWSCHDNLNRLVKEHGGRTK